MYTDLLNCIKKNKLYFQPFSKMYKTKTKQYE